MLLACCFLGKVLGIGCHYFPPPSDIRTSAARYLHVCTTREILAATGGTIGREYCPVNLAEMTSSTPFWDLLHGRKVRHGSDGFTSLPKEGVLRIFFALKIRRLRPGWNPRTRVPNASTLTPRPTKPLAVGYRDKISGLKNVSFFIHCLIKPTRQNIKQSLITRRSNVVTSLRDFDITYFLKLICVAANPCATPPPKSCLPHKVNVAEGER